MRSNSRHGRALARQQKNLDKLDMAWKIWKSCEVCGNQFCVNCGWDDRQPRTPKLHDMVICPNCDPRAYTPFYPNIGNQIKRTRKGRFQYQVVMALVILRKMADRPCETDKEECKCIPCSSRKLRERMSE